jgi:cytochrome c-type biogenesis protein CcmH
VVSAGPLDDEQVDRVIHNLMCTCGCPHLIGQCGDECGLAPKLIQEIRQEVAAGKTDEEIYALFESRYGHSVRAVPRAEGFNLLAWVMPFVGLFCGALIVVVVVRNLKTAESGVSSQEQASEVTDEYRKLIDEELNR